MQTLKGKVSSIDTLSNVVLIEIQPLGEISEKPILFLGDGKKDFVLHDFHLQDIRSVDFDKETATTPISLGHSESTVGIIDLKTGQIDHVLDPQ